MQDQPQNISHHGLVQVGFAAFPPRNPMAQTLATEGGGLLNADMKNDVQKQFDKLNHRRHELIIKKYEAGGLTPEEQEEMDDLQTRVGNVIHSLWPLVTKELRELHDSLKKSQQNHGD